MLQPFEAKSPIAGTLVSILPVGSEVHAGALLARIRDSSGNTQEFRSAVDGKITAPVVTKEGDTITANQTIAWLAPDHMTILASLRALAYVGTLDDIPLVESSAKIDSLAETISEAAATAKAIQARLG
jgi:pyruvate/2-oxoglutarate dehydrogenase complex dihydrolipoamide acyltransferase (E2) component